MKRFLPALLVVIPTFGCVTNTGPSTGPSIVTISNSVSTTYNELAITVDPFLDPERQNAFLSYNFTGRGLLAAHVTLRNDGNRSVELHTSEIRLVLADGTVLRPKDAKTIYELLPVLSDEDLEGLGRAWPAKQMIRKEERKIRRIMINNYKRMRLKDGRLGPKETQSGFLYFVAKSGKVAFDQARLQVAVVQEPGPVSFLQVKLGEAEKGPKAFDVIAAPKATPIFVEPPRRVWSELRTYIRQWPRNISGELSRYNAAHQLVVAKDSQNKVVSNMYRADVAAAYGDTVWLDIHFTTDETAADRREPSKGRFHFRFEWQSTRLVLVNHKDPNDPIVLPAYQGEIPVAPALVMQEAETSVGAVSGTEQPLYADWQVRGYVRHHEKSFKNKLREYAASHKLGPKANDVSLIREIYQTKVVEARGREVALKVNFKVGTSPSAQDLEVIFDLEWRNDHLVFLGHRS